MPSDTNHPSPQEPRRLTAEDMALVLREHYREFFRITPDGTHDHCLRGDYDDAQANHLAYMLLNEGAITTAHAVALDALAQCRASIITAMDHLDCALTENGLVDVGDSDAPRAFHALTVALTAADAVLGTQEGHADGK